ncbi:MAG: ABC transporter permease [Chlorobiaceae bacterium]|nr:ABC transporter permease [Chlorobiaceae bacterium]
MNTIKIVKIAFRNLLRNSRRTLITILVSSSGFAALAIVAGYMDFTFYGLKEMTICSGFTASGGTGHIQVFKHDALVKEEQYTLQYGIDGYKDLQSQIESVPGVSFSMPRIEFNGLISNGDKSVSFLGLGVDPVKEAALTNYWNSLERIQAKMDDTAYKNLQKNGSSGVLLGQNMAKALNAVPGSNLMLMSTTIDGAVNVVDVTVAGIMKSSMKSIDEHYLVTQIETVQNLLQTEKISKIVVVVDKTDHTSTILPMILKKINNDRRYTITPWEKLAEYYHSIRDVYNIIFSFTGIIVVAIVFLSCTNTMLMATMERIREIGTLKAVGVSDKWISLMFLLEGFFIGCASIVLGILLKFLFAGIINNINIKMPPPPGMSATYFLKIYSAYDYLPWIALLILVSTTFSGMLTLFKIRKLSIVNSLTHV